MSVGCAGLSRSSAAVIIIGPSTGMTRRSGNDCGIWPSAVPDVGDKFIFTADGCCVNKEPPGLVCLSALAPLIPMLNTVVPDNIMAGIDPQSPPLWDTIHCNDVGVENGGWGEIIMKIRIEKI